MSEDTQWRARVFADKVLKKEVQKEIESLALVVLGNHELKITHKKEGFDQYPHCRNWEKKYCPVGGRKKTYMGKWGSYIVYGETRTDIFLEVLRCLANDSSLYFPIVSCRPDNEWVEREKVEKYKDEE
ncbi:hypothetical protein [Aneurinibacillus aneurinilyticus]|jgi:hypothetical protein|uniref:hypothetical protein n=1 Tax=Aneurinibacillus aneurinilyticus TaxID=1391 RepID=UPI0023F75AB5|nr:hypothetical protein [Aneurinibacillus aneurinilyticus]MCI1696482.1 hypothetical protein [Aneurinibacillus aneurinilyticus]